MLVRCTTVTTGVERLDGTLTHVNFACLLKKPLLVKTLRCSCLVRSQSLQAKTIEQDIEDEFGHQLDGMHGNAVRRTPLNLNHALSPSRLKIESAADVFRSPIIMRGLL